MASLNGGFKQSEVPDSKFDALPEGEYRALITESEVKPTKAKDGSLINLKWQILDGPHKNRTVLDRVNWENKNPTAQMIGRQQLKKIAKAVGAPEQFADTSILHMKPCIIKVIVGEYNGEPKNEVKGYKAALPSSSQPAATAATATAGKPVGW
jgi:hypothetical protein